MAVQDVANAFHSILGAAPSLHVDLGYVLAMAGIVILLAFTVGLAVLVAVRVARAIANMTVEKFVVTTAILAGILIIAGSLLP